MQSTPADLPDSYYSFDAYVTRARWLTYYEQLDIILATQPRRVLEVGIGPGVVKAVLNHYGSDVTTVDVNPALNPDVVADVRDLPGELRSETWDWIICSRVLHHLPKAEVEETLRAVSKLSFRRVLLTVPREDLSVQVTVRRTAGRAHRLRLSAGSRFKRVARRGIIRSAPSGLWMVNGADGIPQRAFAAALRRHFEVKREFVFADDPSHLFYVLAPK